MRADAKRRIGWIAGLIALVGLPFAAACAAVGAPMTPDPGGGDASASDAGAALDAALVPNPGRGASELLGDEVACADFLDDDAGGGADCTDMNCARSHVCCVQSTSVECCAAPAIAAPALDFRSASCATSSPAASCVSGVTGFGTAASAFVRDIDAVGSFCADGMGAMAPQGGARSDAGLLFEQSYDTGAAAVALEAHVGVGSAATGSIDAIALGLTEQTDLAGANARVRVTVGIVVSATDQTVRAVAGDVAFEAYPLSTAFAAGECQELDLRIETSPRGTFDAFYRRHDETGATTWMPLALGQSFQPRPLARPVVYGRTTNPGIEGVHAWVRSVGVASALCDVLAPARSASTVFTGSVTAANVRSVSRLGALAAYEIEGTIYSAGVDGNGHIDPTTAPTNPALIDPLLAPGSFYGAGAFDPELTQIGVNARLYFTGLSATGVRSIGYLDFTSDLMARVTGSTPRALLSPGDIGVLGVDGPSYLETTEATGARKRLLVFRAVVADGPATHSEIRALELNGSDAILGADMETITDFAGAADTPAYYSRSSPFSPGVALYRNRVDDETAFDRDEVGQPEIVAYHGVFRIFFAGRRGARWSIGMIRSPDLTHFDLASPTPILTGSGNGFDAVSVSDPDAFIEGDALSLYYSGTNGVETRPGLATQRVPTP